MYYLRWTEGYPPGIAQMVERLTVDQLVTCSESGCPESNIENASSFLVLNLLNYKFKIIEL